MRNDRVTGLGEVVEVEAVRWRDVGCEGWLQGVGVAWWEHTVADYITYSYN